MNEIMAHPASDIYAAATKGKSALNEQTQNNLQVKKSGCSMVCIGS